MRRRNRVILLLLVAAVAVIAFLLLRGGGDEAGPELPQGEFVARANAICAELAESNDALEPPFRPYDPNAAPFFAGVHDNVVRARDAFDELSPPAAGRDALDRLVAGYDTIDAGLDSVEAAAAVEQDGEVVAQVLAIGTETEAIAAAERELGICPGETSVRNSVFAVLRRTRDNPLTQTGVLVP